MRYETVNGFTIKIPHGSGYPSVNWPPMPPAHEKMDVGKWWDYQGKALERVKEELAWRKK